MEKHIEIIERMMFAMANHTVDGKRICPTLKAAKGAIEKQIPKKPYTDNENGIYEKDYCPTCNRVLFPDDHHCKCGQSLDWSDVVRGL